MNSGFDAERFQETLQTLGSAPVRHLVLHASIDSTSNDLKRRLDNGVPIDAVVVAHGQTAGRGRSGRHWFSEASHNLYLSLALTLKGPIATLVPLVPLAAGVSAIDAVKACSSATPRLKWPNDLLENGRKLGGILSEMVASRPDRAVLIVGIGINIGAQPFPSDIAEIATAIPDSAELPVDRSALAAHFVCRLRAWATRIQAGEHDALIAAWRDRAEPFGRRVRVGAVEGVTRNLTDDGRLIICQDNGEEARVVGGIVESLE